MSDNNHKQLNMTDIMYILNEGIHDLYSINVATRKITAYRMSGLANGIDNGLVVGKSYEELMEIYIEQNVIPEEKATMRAFVSFDSIMTELYDNERFIYHYRVIRDGQIYYYYLKCVRVGDSENITDVIFAFTPENADANRESLINTIEMDDLTCVLTRQAFMNEARRLLDENPDGIFDLVVTDVVNFKLINSIYGIKVGDEVLQHLGIYLTQHTTKVGCIGRYGGDKFVGFGLRVEERRQEWMLDLIDGVNKNAPIPNIVIKCGVYADVDRNLTIMEMCDRALLAVKSIKHNYSVPYATFDGPLSMSHLKAQTFETKFETAVQNDEFKVWYQPKYDANTEEVRGAEALVRWITKDGEFISPGDFVPVFEEDGLVVRLDEIVFRKVCSNIKGWLDKGVKVFPISVNLSRATLTDDTVDRYKKIVEEIGVPLEYVPLELTESAAIQSKGILNMLRKFKKEGFTLHMDDFGSGESSLASINILPFDIVKLDKSIVDQIGDPGGNEIIRHTIELAHFKNMTVVAEGVETKAQLNLLRHYGCDMIQGYYYSPPRPYDAFVEFFNKTQNNVLESN